MSTALRAAQKSRAQSLYRRSLKHVLSWAVNRELFWTEVRRARRFPRRRRCAAVCGHCLADTFALPLTRPRPSHTHTRRPRRSGRNSRSTKTCVRWDGRGHGRVNKKGSGQVLIGAPLRVSTHAPTRAFQSIPCTPCRRARAAQPGVIPTPMNPFSRTPSHPDPILPSFFPHAKQADQFEAERLLARGEAALARRSHPDLYTVPYRPGGTLWARNSPVSPLLHQEFDFGREAT
jgi:hypothetical protein